MTARETIFTGIRQALEPLKDRTPYPEYDTSVAEPHWLSKSTDTAALFQTRLTSTGGLVFDSITACRDWLTSEKISRLFIDPSLTEVIAAMSGLCEITTTYHRDQVDLIDAAITLAAGGIAESGTIILTDTSTPDRLAALAPWRHIAALRRENLHLTIGSALAALPDDPNIIWVTGPSKTADVEGILIQGVHGPGQQACLLL